MPDILTHYAASLLVSSRFSKLKHAILIALFGLLPDIDALFRVHRWFTHSLLITLCLAAITFAISRKNNPALLKTSALATLLYSLHIIMDIFTAPTPILWPLLPTAIMVSINVDAILNPPHPQLLLNASLYQETVDFSPKPFIEGPLITKTGIILFLVTLIIITSEYVTKRKP